MARVTSLSVLHVTPALAEKPTELRDQVRDCLRAGMDVIVICDVMSHRRAVRLAVATAKQHGEFPNVRLAIVTPDTNAFVESLPSVVAENLTMFQTEDEAIDWLGVNGPIDGFRSTVLWPMAV